MDIKTISVAFVAIMVGAVAFGAMLPIFQDVTATEEVFINEGVRMSPVGDDTLIIEYASDVVTVNGVQYDYTARPISQGTIMFYETAHSSRVGYLYVEVDGSYTRANVNRTDTMTMTYTGTTKTCHIQTVHNGTEYISDYTYTEEVYYINPTGQYIWSGEKPNTAYIPDDWDNFNTWSDGADYFYAVIQDDIQINYQSPPDGTTTELITSDVSGYEGIKVIDSYTLNIPEQAPIDCRGYILPYQVTAEKITPPGFNTIVELIPLVIGMGLLLIAVWWFVVRKF